MHHNPTRKLQLVRDPQEQRTIQSLMEIIDQNFGLDYNLSDGRVVEVQMVATGLVVIPRQLREFKHLYKVQLPSNKIQRLRNIEILEQLTVLNLNDNQLTSNGISNLNKSPNLEIIDFSMNDITNLEVFSGLANLESLNVADNVITEIPPLELPKLKYLDISRNPIKNLRNIHLFPFLIDLKMSPGKLPKNEQDLIKSGDLKLIQEYCRNI